MLFINLSPSFQKDRLHAVQSIAIYCPHTHIIQPLQSVRNTVSVLTVRGRLWWCRRSPWWGKSSPLPGVLYTPPSWQTHAWRPLSLTSHQLQANIRYRKHSLHADTVQIISTRTVLFKGTDLDKEKKVFTPKVTVRNSFGEYVLALKTVCTVPL